MRDLFPCSGFNTPSGSIVQTRVAQTKPVSCFACNKLGHWREQRPNTAKLPTGQLLAAGDIEQFQGVVNSIFVSNSPNDIFYDDFSKSDRLDKVVEVKSLLNYEFSSGQYNYPLVRGRLAGAMIIG